MTALCPDTSGSLRGECVFVCVSLLARAVVEAVGRRGRRYGPVALLRLRAVVVCRRRRCRRRGDGIISRGSVLEQRLVVHHVRRASRPPHNLSGRSGRGKTNLRPQLVRSPTRRRTTKGPRRSADSPASGPAAEAGTRRRDAG